MKKYIFSAAALVLALAGSAFTSQRSDTLYQFNGDATNIKDASQYSVISTPPSGCSGSSLPCYVSTDEDITQWLSERTSAQVVADAAADKN